MSAELAILLAWAMLWLKSVNAFIFIVMLVLKGYGHHCNVHRAEQGPSAQPDTGQRA
jgi:hypothetical protein